MSGRLKPELREQNRSIINATTAIFFLLSNTYDTFLHAEAIECVHNDSKLTSRLLIDYLVGGVAAIRKI